MRGFDLILRLILGGMLAVAGCSSSDGGGQGGEGGMGGSTGSAVSVGGIAWAFELPGLPYGRIKGATVSILEMPELSTESNDEGEFTIEGIPVGSQATFVLQHDDHPLTYTKTFTIPDSDIDDLTFQIPTNFLFGQIEDGLVEGGIIEGIDVEKCQMVSTFTRYGKTIGDPGPHGEAGAVLSVAPANNAEYGPMYFNDEVLPDPTRSYSSLDGGVLLLNVDPGDYTLSASCVENPSDLYDDFLAEYPPATYPDEALRCQTEDVEFEPVLMKCRPGVFLNASPSYGLQAFPHAP
ncbi:MAG TPA: hypothetical protein VFG22_19095 [Polyangiales bacterium]|nr:hypothetical protein [Polyangiales bacterium]